eukprot:scaffold150649_cov17-Tisochrysis_lutea.AAC.1
MQRQDQGLFCTHFDRKGGFPTLHQVTSAPGLWVLLGRLIILQWQILQAGLLEGMLLEEPIKTGVQAKAESYVALQTLHILAT